MRFLSIMFVAFADAAVFEKLLASLLRIVVNSATPDTVAQISTVAHFTAFLPEAREINLWL
jgi:hypothetical protein